MTDEEPIQFKWNAEEVLKLLDRGYRIVLFKDGLGDITAIAVSERGKLDATVKEWRLYDPPAESLEDIQRSVFDGINRFGGGGRSVAAALHCLTEKVVFRRLPDGKGGYLTPPENAED